MGCQECTLISFSLLLPIKKNIFRQIHVHAMYCSFEQRFGVMSSLLIRTVVVDLSAFLRINYFPVLNTLCECSAMQFSLS